MCMYIYIYRPRGMCVFLFSLLRMQGIRVSHIQWLSSLSWALAQSVWLSGARVVYFWKVFTLFFTLECAIKAQNHWTWQVSQQMSDMISGVFSLWCFHCIPDYCMLRLWHMALLVIHPPTFAIRGTGLTSWLWHDAQTGAGLELWEFVLDHAFFSNKSERWYEYIMNKMWIFQFPQSPQSFPFRVHGPCGPCGPFWGRWSLRCDAVWGTLFSEACQGPQMADLGWLRNSWGLMGLLMQRCKHRNGKCLENPNMDELIPIDGSHLGHRNQAS